MKARTILLWSLVAILLLSFIQSASALEKQISITSINLVNGSGTLRVNGTLFSCENNICTAYISYDCPACPACPAVDYNDLKANFSSVIAASQEKILKSIIEHNSSPDFKRADIEALLADDDEAGKIQDFIQNTVMVKDNDYKNMTGERDYWMREYERVNASNTIKAEKIQSIEDDNKRLENYVWIFGLALFVVVGVLVVSMKWEKEGIGSLPARIRKVKDKFGPGERDLQRIIEENERLAEEAEIKKALEINKAYKTELGIVEPEIIRHAETIAKVEKKSAPIETPIVTVPSRQELKSMVADYIKSQDGYSFYTQDFYDHFRQKGINDESLLSSLASGVKEEISKTAGGTWKINRLFSGGKMKVQHEYLPNRQQDKEEEDV